MLCAVTGVGIFEIGSCHFLAEDVFVSGNGLAFNDDGLEQMKPVIARSAGLDTDDMTFLHIEFPGSKYYDAPQIEEAVEEAGVSRHRVLGAVPLLGQTVPWKVEGVNVPVGGGQRMDVAAPAIGERSDAVDQHQMVVS